MLSTANGGAPLHTRAKIPTAVPSRSTPSCSSSGARLAPAVTRGNSPCPVVAPDRGVFTGALAVGWGSAAVPWSGLSPSRSRPCLQVLDGSSTCRTRSPDGEVSSLAVGVTPTTQYAMTQYAMMHSQQTHRVESGDYDDETAVSDTARAEAEAYDDELVALAEAARLVDDVELFAQAQLESAAKVAANAKDGEEEEAELEATLEALAEDALMAAVNAEPHARSSVSQGGEQSVARGDGERRDARRHMSALGREHADLDREHADRLERVAWMTADPRTALQMLCAARSQKMRCSMEPQPRTWQCLDLVRRDQAKQLSREGERERGLCEHAWCSEVQSPTHRGRIAWMGFVTSMHALLGCDTTLCR